MELLETQLRAWAPRRPSAKLRRRLFGSACAKAPKAFSLNWLAPATAALLVMTMLFNQRHCASLITAGQSGPFVAMILSNQNAAASLPAGFQSEQNGWPADTFDSREGIGLLRSFTAYHRPNRRQ
jgi:hypothetical protein